MLATLPLILASAPADAAPQAPIFSEAHYDAHSRQVVPRDTFPVLNSPEMADASAGDEELRADEPVIGVALNGESKAYPISVMGRHELANDVIGNVPIAASW